MSSSSVDTYNKIISTVNSVTSDYELIPDPSNVVTIDTSNNRIGIGTLNPEKSLHIKGDTNSGIITTNLELSGGHIKSDLIPKTDLSYSLGTEDKRWKELHVNDVSVNKLDIPFNEDLSYGLYFNSEKLLFYDSGKSMFKFTKNIEFTETVNISGTTVAQEVAAISTGTIDDVSMVGSRINSTTIGKFTPHPGYFTDLNSDTLTVQGSTTLSSTLTVDSDISLNSVTESTSSTSGALKVAGGVGIAGDLNVGRDASFNQDVEISNNLLVKGDASFNKDVEISNNLLVKGDIDVSGTLDVTQATTISSTLTVDGAVNLNNEQSSTNSSDGALVVAGGVGIAKGLNVGGDALFNQDVEITGELNIHNKIALNNNYWRIYTYYSDNVANMEIAPNIEESYLYGYGKRMVLKAGYNGMRLEYSSPNGRGDSYIYLHNNLTIESQQGPHSDGTMGHLDLKAGRSIRQYANLGISSDNRLKHNEVNIVNALDNIRQLKPLKYQKTHEMYEEYYTGDISGYYYIESGFIAQDVLNIADLNYTVIGGDYIDDSGNNIEQRFFLTYNDIFVYNVAATKELDAIVQEQQTEINELKQENTLLKTALNEILSEMGKPTI